MKNLKEVSVEEQKEFFNSFDHVLCDMDGVIWLADTPIPGASSCISNLKKVGKHIVYVTNSPFETTDKLRAKLTAHNLDRNEALATPAIAMISYLKSVGMKEKIYVIGTSDFKAEFQKSGYTLVSDPPQIIGESFTSMNEYIQDDTDVGAVIIVYDFNCTALKIQKAVTYLKRSDCIYIRGGDDKAIPVSGNFGPILAYHYLFKAVADICGRDGVQLAKPSKDFAKYVMKQFNIEDPKKVLFIGDSVHSDMGFATNVGYRKLLVLSGLTKKDDILHWKYPEDFKPDYYVENMNALSNILQSVFKLS